ncbi:MAG: geranylgeranylglyceryl/heptaprenylglyceryl phosphate synthase [Flavobacteriales bacterium]|jgi:putative glycerol-1-phosphate prenyltransferase|tara:strand:+ start:352 stop:1083 length:732 start_codon:yes stop_codon:yes gene_type:complete
MIKEIISSKISKGEKQWCVLIDPDKLIFEEINELISLINSSSCDFILVGGSLINHQMFDDYLKAIKRLSSKPVLIFPGDNQQISKYADGLFLLSLISGRNPELLIGQHVKSAFKIRASNLEVLPCGYILIEGESLNSAIYMSESLPIPKNKSSIAAATALAGEQLGMQFIYLDKGSGAEKSIGNKMIIDVKKTINIPLIVGGGINSQQDLENVWNAGADIAVIGTSIEKNFKNIFLFNKIPIK